VKKTDFIERVAAEGEISKAEAAKAVELVLDSIKAALARGEEVAFSGFGKFHVSERSAREGVHPRTGERIQIKASRSPKFKSGSVLKKAVNS